MTRRLFIAMTAAVLSLLGCGSQVGLDNSPSWLLPGSDVSVTQLLPFACRCFRPHAYPRLDCSAWCAACGRPI